MPMPSATGSADRPAGGYRGDDPPGQRGRARLDDGHHQAGDGDDGAAVEPLELLAALAAGVPVPGDLDSQPHRPAEHQPEDAHDRGPPDETGRATGESDGHPAGVEPHRPGQGRQHPRHEHHQAVRQPGSGQGPGHRPPAPGRQPHVREEPQTEGKQDQAEHERRLQRDRERPQRQAAVVEPVVQDHVGRGTVTDREEQAGTQHQPAERVSGPPGCYQRPDGRCGQHRQQPYQLALRLARGHDRHQAGDGEDDH